MEIKKKILVQVDDIVKFLKYALTMKKKYKFNI